MEGDPSQKVHPDLLPHVHLLSTYRYAMMPRVELQEVTKWLLKAKSISRQTAPFFWTFLEGPQDGSIFLCWQPTATRGTEFASDGYIWPSPEHLFRQDAGNGLVLEIYYQATGYRPGEQFSTHSRRRFRLVPGQPQAPVTDNLPIDPNLWIVHYGPAEKAQMLPTNSLPISPPNQHMLQVRSQLFQMGQIVRKDFILSDRRNWPEIPLPARGQSIYAPPVPTRNVPPTMAYPPHGAPAVGPTPKRRGGGQGAAHPSQMPGAPPFPGMESIFDDDEDISRGDMFDHLTPQELSLHRYQQNHEWMEEILSSPYRIGQIEVADLGLGRKGELASLTDGVFEAQGSGNWQKGPKKPYTGHLNPILMAEFEKRVKARNAAVEAEVEQMKQQHEKALQDLLGSTAIKRADQELRFAAEETGSEFWRLEGRVEDSEEGPGRWAPQGKSFDDILARVEEIVGKKAAVVHSVYRVQEGGYQEPAPVPEPVQLAPPKQPDALGMGQSASMSRQPSHSGSQNSGVMIGDSDIDMGGTAAGLLDQMHAGFSSTSTPINNFPTPQPHLSAIPSTVATPANLNVPSPLPTQAPTSRPPASLGDDIRMEDADVCKGPATAPDQGTGSGDWVVVPKGGLSPNNTGAPPSLSHLAATSTADGGSSSKPTSAAPTPGDALGFDSNDFSSLGDLDTAGDALAGYDPPSVDGGGLGDLNMDMEDSAFGDAFHGVQQSGGNTPADGM